MSSFIFRGIRSKFLISVATTLLCAPGNLSAAENFALQFGASGSGVLVPNSPSINLSGPFTVEAWVKADPSLPPNNLNFVLSKQLFGSGYTLLANLVVGVKVFQFQAYDVANTAVNGTSAVSANTWTHVAGVWDASGIASLYVNGKLEGATAVPLPPEQNSQNLQIGNSVFGDNLRWFGLIDEVRIWNVARSAADINSLMLVAADIAVPGLVARWGFDEGSGAVAHDSTTNHNDGFITGASFVIDNDLNLAPLSSICPSALTPSSQIFSASGGLGSLTVNAPSTCTWTPVPSANWITILPSGSKGTAKVSYAVAPSAGGARTGTISIGGQTFSLSETGFSCSYAISPGAASLDNTGGSARVVVSAPAGCSWTTSNNASWITVASGASGSGNGTVVVSIGPNPAAPRSGTVTIAGQTFTVAEGAGVCGAVDVSSKVRVAAGQFILFSIGFGSTIVTQNVSLTNTSPGVVVGPVYLALLGLPTHHHPNALFPPFDSGLLVDPPGTTLTTCFTPAGDYLIPISGNLSPGQTVSLGNLQFVEGSYPLTYSAKVISGTPSH